MKKIIPYLIGLGLSGASVLAVYTPNYTATDMPNIVTDNLGEAGVQFKTYMPLFILGVVALIVVGAIVKIKRVFWFIKSKS